jgi:hypothetical protein
MAEETQEMRRVRPNGTRVRVADVDHHGLNRDDVEEPPAASVGREGVICGNIVEQFDEGVWFLGHTEDAPHGQIVGQYDIVFYRVQLFAEGDNPGGQYHYADYELKIV